MYRRFWEALAVLTVLYLAEPALAQEPLERLEQTVQSHSLGGRDYWLVIQNAMGELERVALVFGMADDLAFCNSLVDAYRAQFPSSRFHCEPAN